jgi:hypothetical protein
MENDYNFPGDVVFNGTVTLPSATITNDMVNSGAAIAHTKAQHRYQATSIQGATSAVVANRSMLHYAYRAGTVLSGYAMVYTAAASTGRTVTVDVLKSTGGTTGTSILTGTVVFNSTHGGSRTPHVLTLSGTPTLAQGDVLMSKVTVAGSTGTQALGLLVAVNIAENAA